jgi:predicted lipoprotein
MAFPQRRGERKLVAVGTIWTDGSTDVKVMAVQSWGDYKYVTYRKDGRRTNEDPIDIAAFTLRYTAKVVAKTEVKANAMEIKADPDSGKIRSVGWAG